jgi:hypothetical protein
VLEGTELFGRGNFVEARQILQQARELAECSSGDSIDKELLQRIDAIVRLFDGRRM